jgi:[acyl-carrier-protein] S-malonyltransferase
MTASHTAFVFPGQGSQKVGMGKDWFDRSPAARQAFEEADEALGFALSQLCFEGPEEDLQLTANTQPALLVASVAAYRGLVEAGYGDLAAVVAGHSLGEYSALVAADALDLSDALRLVRRRGELMQEAVPVGIGGMAAIMGLSVAEVGNVAQDASDGDQVCTLANMNSELQTVLAGHRPAVERAVALARERGAKKAVMLPVSAPFHSPLMAPAREGLEPLLRAAAFADPRVPVVTNVDAAPVTTGDAAREALIRQVDGPVRWTESVEAMAGALAVDRFVEVGPGKVLTGLNRRIARGRRCLNISSPDDLGKLDGASEDAED